MGVERQTGADPDHMHTGEEEWPEPDYFFPAHVTGFACRYAQHHYSAYDQDVANNMTTYPLLFQSIRQVDLFRPEAVLALCVVEDVR